MLGLKDEEGDTAAIICFAFTNEVPRSVEEMDLMSQDAANQAVLQGWSGGQDSGGLHGVGS
jgi:hypothetical protein